MSTIQMTIAFEYATVELPCAFIDYYLPHCTPVYALIYIYSLRRCAHGSAALSSQEISQTFHILETDVLNAWRYWESTGLIQLDEQADGMSLTFLPVHAPQPATIPAAVAPEPKPVADLEDESPPEGKHFVPSLRPQYTVEELAIYRQQSRDVERLFEQAEQVTGKLLTYHDLNVIFGFYDWLRLPMDVLLYMFSYCAERNNRDLRYIETVALDWAEHSINDLEKALAYVQSFDRIYRDILRVMGQDTGYPTPSQTKYIRKWMDDCAMTPELILLACDKAAIQIGKPKFSYVDRIINRWHKKGLQTLEQIEKEDENFNARKADAATRVESSAARPKTNRFVNFKQRERDYDKIEKMEREYLIQSLKG